MKKIGIIGVAMMLMCMSFAMAETIVDVDMDVESGFVEITANGIDHSTWNTGSIGETNIFTGNGGFTGDYTVNDGTFGKLNSYININSKEYGADFVMRDTQDFNILSANHDYNVVGNFYAHASGNDDRVAMNLKSVGSMYVWSEATNRGIALQGSVIEKQAWTTKNGDLQSNVYLGVDTNGLASISNQYAWGWGNRESGSSGDYGSGIRTVSSTGDGTYTQSGFGANSLTFNGFNFGAGSASFIGAFTGGMTGPYSMSAS